jgi:1,2-diacylglycerol 3-alpha-glucosyltransferase
MALRSLFLRQCTAVITPTHMTANEVDAHTGVRPLVIGNGANLDCFRPGPNCPDEAIRLREKYGLDPRLPILLHVGRLDADKQVERVIQAAARVMKKEPCQLLVIGDGHLRKRLVAMSAALGIGERCYFPGFVTADGDLPGLYRSASLFVTASEIETFGLVILEAMASGLPVVAPRATCLPELVEDGRNGYLTYPGDEIAMAERIWSLLREPEKAGKMGVIGRSKAMWFTADTVIAQHEKLYTSLVEGVPATAPLPEIVKSHSKLEARLRFDN